MATPAQRTNTWTLDQWYAQDVAGTQGLQGLTPNVELWVWGNNGNGNLGQNDIVNRSSPVQVPSSWSGDRFKTEAPGHNFGQLNVGVQCGQMIKGDGTMWYIGGWNNMGSSGVNINTQISSPVQVPGNWSAVSGTLAQVARKADGTIWGWGRAQNGALGLNNETQRSSPTQIGTDTTWDYINGHSLVNMATKTDGSAWMWGDNEFGALGLNNSKQANNARYSSPTQLGNTGDWTNHNGFAFSRNVLSASIKSDGSLWTWGSNGNPSGSQFNGVLGHNDIVQRSSPVQVGTNTTWTGFMWADEESALGLKTDGTIWSWGKSSFGRLGLNQPHNTYYSSPTQIGTNSDWVRVGKSGTRALGALNSSNELYVWGYNDTGNLGLNDRTNRSSPTQIEGTWYGISNSYSGFGSVAFGAKISG